MNFDELVKPRGAQSTATATRAGGDVVGGLPRVSLLPKEIHNAARDRSVRRIIVFVFAGVVGLTAGAVALATVYAGASQGRLDAATQRAQVIAVQIAKFGPVSKLQKELAVGTAAVQVGTSTQVDWQGQIDAIEQYMPAGFTVTTITADSATVNADYQQGDSPLELPRAATVTLTADSTDISGLPRWLRMIRQVPAYADASASITHEDSTGYSVQVIVHLTAKALDKTVWKEWVK